MVFLVLNGGLGNQMFQYALGKQLAILNKTKMVMLFDNRGTVIRHFELGHFGIGPYIPYLSIIERMLNVFGFKSIVQGDVNFFDDILKNKGNLIVRGFWQSEKYFDGIKELVVKDFRLEDKHNIKLKTGSVCVHFRKLDYVNNLSHDVLDCNYYTKAFELMKSKIGNPTFYIVSDDINTIKNEVIDNLKGNIVFVENLDTFQTMKLMTDCENMIMANSSFSWWGAWLNPNQNKLIIAPKKWFNDISIKTEDRFPRGWSLI